MHKKICIISDLHISANPRVWKEAGTLSRNGYDVTIVTIDNSAVHQQRDKAILAKLGSNVKYVVADCIIPNQISPFRRLFYKFRTVVARLLKNFNYDTVYLISNVHSRIYNGARKVNADLYIGHVDVSLIVGKKLIKAGYKVAFDIEDWYSEDYLNKYRPVGLLRKLESFAIRNGIYVSCPSLAMAKALSDRYDSNKQVHVLYNGFESEPYIHMNKSTETAISLVWFSQTVGVGRGIERIIAALGNVSLPVKLVLIGDCSAQYRSKLDSLFPFNSGHSLEVIGQVPHHDLHKLLTTFDIGLALENNYPLNKTKTISNKILQYLQAGIKVLATNTDGQVEVANHFPDAVMVVDAVDESDWSKQLELLIAKTIDSKNVVERLNAVFSWEQQEKKLLQLVSNVL